MPRPSSQSSSAAVVLGAASPVWAQAGPGTALDGQFHVALVRWDDGRRLGQGLRGHSDRQVFSDIMKEFHFGFLGHFEGRKDHFSYATDIMYVNPHVPLAADRPVLGQLGLDATVKSTTVEGLGLYGAATGGPKDNPAGLRFRALGSKAAFIGRGDVAGFGSRATWNAEGDLALRLSEHWTTGAGWRHMSIDYDKAQTDRQLFHLAYDGPRAWFAYAR